PGAARADGAALAARVPGELGPAADGPLFPLVPAAAAPEGAGLRAVGAREHAEGRRLRGRQRGLHLDPGAGGPARAADGRVAAAARLRGAQAGGAHALVVA